MRTYLLPPYALLLLALAGPALAVDGVLEINQACAVNTGCFPGDTPGFPVTISGFPPESSYRLTSSLQVPGTNTDGLFLVGSHITIDFNGFSLSNLTLVAGTGNAVTASGSGPFPPTAPFATIKNGVIRQWGGRGIDLGLQKGVRVENMTLEGCVGGALGPPTVQLSMSAMTRRS